MPQRLPRQPQAVKGEPVASCVHILGWPGVFISRDGLVCLYPGIAWHVCIPGGKPPLVLEP